MTKEELKEQDIRLNKLCFDYQEKEKRIEEIEEKISVLLSCKNCPENKGGLICQKEYENKCLTQKIQFIKELQKENAQLKQINSETLTQFNLDNGELIIENEKLKKENAELKDYRLTTLAKQQTDMSKYALNLEHKLSWYDNQLTKAKELLERLLITSCNSDVLNLLPNCSEVLRVRVEAEQFLNSEGK